MLRIRVPCRELYDEIQNQFIQVEEQHLRLEHSLVSLSKWEQKWRKPFLGKEDKTFEETVDYIRCMDLDEEKDLHTYMAISSEDLERILNYINEPMTATWFNEKKHQPKNGETVTAEIIYYWMFSLQIPKECETWHLNRLLTQIRVINVKNTPQKKMNKNETAKHYRDLNNARRKKWNSTG